MAAKERMFPLTRGMKAEPVGRLADDVGREFVLQGADQHGEIVEWVVRPTGANSFELVVPEGHELGTPAAWDNISILAQRVVSRAGEDGCGCDGSQCGCQGSNCGSNSHALRGELRLRASDADLTRFTEPGQ